MYNACANVQINLPTKLKNGIFISFVYLNENLYY